jgi:predicted DNA-binding transcriptional regulator AlpA
MIVPKPKSDELDTWYSFRELVAAGIVRNRQTLLNWIRDRGFPPGKLLGPNTRRWSKRHDIDPWIASRPTAADE